MLYTSDGSAAIETIIADQPRAIMLKRARSFPFTCDVAVSPENQCGPIRSGGA